MVVNGWAGWVRRKSCRHSERNDAFSYIRESYFSIWFKGSSSSLPFIIIRCTPYFVKCGRLSHFFFVFFFFLFLFAAISDGRFYPAWSFESTAGRLFGARRNWHASETGCYDARGMLCEWPTELQSRFHTQKCGTMRRCSKPSRVSHALKGSCTCFESISFPCF